mmetsp:Transcript_28521/g.111689  ORF Transcript_28521/g.111689 Transcript_28521/m.111689 type:complete len:100 (-) Transcript_28521:1752-2051(-)
MMNDYLAIFPAPGSRFSDRTRSALFKKKGSVQRWISRRSATASVNSVFLWKLVLTSFLTHRCAVRMDFQWPLTFLNPFKAALAKVKGEQARRCRDVKLC